mgnify:CR=1 FL=1
MRTTRKLCWCGEPSTMFVTVPSQEDLCDDCYANWYAEYVERSPDAPYLGEAFSHLPAPRPA